METSHVGLASNDVTWSTVTLVRIFGGVRASANGGHQRLPWSTGRRLVDAVEGARPVTLSLPTKTHDRSAVLLQRTSVPEYQGGDHQHRAAARVCIARRYWRHSQMLGQPSGLGLGLHFPKPLHFIK